MRRLEFALQPSTRIGERAVSVLEPAEGGQLCRERSQCAIQAFAEMNYHRSEARILTDGISGIRIAEETMLHVADQRLNETYQRKEPCFGLGEAKQERLAGFEEGKSKPVRPLENAMLIDLPAEGELIEQVALTADGDEGERGVLALIHELTTSVRGADLANEARQAVLSEVEALLKECLLFVELIHLRERTYGTQVVESSEPSCIDDHQTSVRGKDSVKRHHCQCEKQKPQAGCLGKT